MSEEPEASAPQALQKWLGIVGVFIAHATVISTLCYFFGYLSTKKYFDHFGIDSDAIGFTTSDYVIRSVRALYLPIVVLLFAWVALLWAGEYIRRVVKAGRRTRLIGAVAWIVIAVGALCMVRAIVGMTYPKLALDNTAELTPTALGLGSALLVVGFWLLRATRTRLTPHPFATAERAGLVVAAAAILLAIFWLTDIYAGFRGEDDAKTNASQLWWRETSVVLDTKERLAAPSNLIKETILAPEDRGKKPTLFREECFRTLEVHGDRWVLVPAKWTDQNGYAVIIRADSSNRISFTKLLGIAKTPAANWVGRWQCPEVAP